MSTEIWKLSKFEVAERQLLQAIRLFFYRGDEISIHTLAEAAAQVLYDTKEQHGGGISIFRDSDRIRPERKKEWLQHVFRSRNFFKHGDKDAGELHEFKAVFNHFSLLDAVNLYSSAKRAWVPETLVFFSWFALAYPSILNDDDPVMRSLVESAVRGPDLIDTQDFSTWAACLEELRSGHRSFQGLVLTAGLPGKCSTSARF
ncbi:hypothetical protein [Pseudoxanthomonas kaohsiungensis]|uniref:Apea-like HEPN domain-containing protein n=1 Tax=Pseudoxanthomonas kaohsiungensis TaxID=283923 RepID=A0ABW3LZK9_9GAMM|nr:hypothetical protein [Pseudoxanthomonas kaohsiungensis]